MASPNAVTLSFIFSLSVLLLFHQSHATSVALEVEDAKKDEVTTTTTTESTTTLDLRTFHVSSFQPSTDLDRMVGHSLRPLRVRRGHVRTMAVPIELPYGNDMLVEKDEEKMINKRKKKDKKLKKRENDSDSDSDSDDEEENEEVMKRARKMKWKKERKEGNGGFLNWIFKYMHGF